MFFAMWGIRLIVVFKLKKVTAWDALASSGKCLIGEDTTLGFRPIWQPKNSF
jgi:hypothetical protein